MIFAEMGVSTTTSRTVTFSRLFILPGMDTPHAPGTFEVRDSREALDVMHEAYRVTSRIVLVDGGKTEVLEITGDELEFALALDEAPIRS
jgi:hypothetical protein